MRQLGSVPEEVLRARRTAALARGCLAVCGLAAAAIYPDLTPAPFLALAGFAIILATALVQVALPSANWLIAEESLAPLAAVLIVGLASEGVTILSLVWLAAVASGVLARGGRMYWIGRAVLLVSLALPVARLHQLTFVYATFVVAAIALLLVCGRVTRELRGMVDRARWDADHDGLTGAFSRAAFRVRLDRIAAESDEHEDLAVLLLDLDNFGAINKSSGHASGDAALVSLVARLRSTLGEEAVIGRLGGDEFGFAVSDPDPVALGRRVLDELEAEGDSHPSLQASIGVARPPRDGHDAESVMRAVDVALRVAKRSGRQQVSLYAGGSLSERDGGARDELERLITGDGLAIAVQPIVATDDGHAHAYEALARFQTAGTSSPLHWFALADELGLRDELELACLREALKLFDGRPEGTLLSVNLSGPLLLDVRTRDLLNGRTTLLGLILEVTENSLLEDTPGMHARITELIGHGVRFAVDDMGAGYSGLRQITTVRPSYLKLDRSLISAIDTDPDRGALVSALLGYARQTGGHLVAEGVETAAELETLTQLGVKLVQGFYLGRPDWPWPGVEPVAGPGRSRAKAVAGSRTV
ncbi:MAG: EAL domain-containing protein [Solirubrobacteraceae bacterium]